MFNRLMFVFACALLLSGCWEYSNGEKIGYIIACSKSGLFFKTNECYLIRGGIQDSSGAFGEKFCFTVEDTDLLKKVKEAMNEGYQVKIKFHEEVITFIRSESKDVFLDDIEELG